MPCIAAGYKRLRMSLAAAACLGLLLVAHGLAAAEPATSAAPSSSGGKAQAAAGASAVKAEPALTKRASAARGEKDPSAWQPLFDGKSLVGWKVCDFGAPTVVAVREGAIVIEPKGIMAGVVYEKPTPTTNYELSLEGKRLAGDDFFCATTFPVGAACCSLVPGGWGGAVSGLSTIDGYDASENLTTYSLTLENEKWYRFRIRVSDAWIECFCDDVRFVCVDREDRTFDVRLECEPCKPLGFAVWRTTGAIRAIKLRQLPAAEVIKINDENIKEREAAKAKRK